MKIFEISPGLFVWSAITFLILVGLLYWLAFGTVVLGSLVANGGNMPAPARPTLTVLVIPPATGGLAWMAAHHGVLDMVGHGFAGLLLFTLLIIAFLILGYLGVEPTTVWGTFPNGVPLIGGDYVALWVARVLTIIYFAFFVLMPWYTANDREKPEPQRVTW